MSNENHKIEVRDLRTGDWIWIHKNILFSQYVSDSAFRVYSGIASYAGNLDQRAWPSLVTLCTKLNMSKTTVVKAIKLLESLDLVKIDKSEGISNTYFLLDCVNVTAPKAPKKEQSPHHRLINFFHTTTQKYRGIKPVWSVKDTSRLKTILTLNIMSETSLEQLMLYFLASPQFKKFTPSMATFFSAGIFNALQNTMKNDPSFWKDLDTFSIQLYGEKKQSGIRETELQKMIAALSKSMQSPQPTLAI